MQAFSSTRLTDSAIYGILDQDRDALVNGFGQLEQQKQAMTERAPPGRASFAGVPISYTARSSRSRIVESDYQEYHAAQDCLHSV